MSNPRVLAGNIAELNRRSHNDSSASASRTFYRQIPIELWSEIFIYCLPQRRYQFPTTRKAPYLVCHVCRAWRDVALSTPRLWCSISLDITEAGFESDMAMIKCWIQRAGVLPMSISLTSRGLDLSHNPIAEIVIPHLSRWYRLNLQFEREFFVPLYNTPECAAAVALEHLKLLIHPGTYPASPILLDNWSAFRSAPRLRSFIYKGICLRPLVQNLPWAQITHLVIALMLSPLDYLAILVQCPKLISISLSRILNLEPSLSFPPPPSSFTLPDLTSIHIHMSRSAYLRILFDHLTLPALNDVAFYDYNPRRDPLSGISFRSLLSRSSCDLVSLVTKFIPSDFLEVLKQIPSLVSLVIGDGRDAQLLDPLLPALTCRSTGADDNGLSCINPKLETFEIAGPGFSQEALAEMVESRWWLQHQITRLKTVRVDFMGYAIDPSAVRRLHKLREEGLELVLNAVDTVYQMREGGGDAPDPSGGSDSSEEEDGF